MQLPKGFKQEELEAEQVRQLKETARQVRGDVLRMIYLAGGGYPGGCLSCADILVTLLAAANVDPADPDAPERDRVLVSPGHLSATLYATLGRMEYVDRDDAVSLFCKAGSVFEGAANRSVPGVEWTNGPQGAGLAAACGFAVAARLKGVKNNIFVLMSDGEQQKGQVAEARRFAKRYRLNNITVVLDANGILSTGRTPDVLAQSIRYEYIADGWDVIEINGHDPNEIYKAVRRAIQIQSAPVLVIAKTTFGCGISFMENDPHYHHAVLSEHELQMALKELRLDEDLSEELDYRTAFGEFDFDVMDEEAPYVTPEVGPPAEYPPGRRVAPTEVFARVLADVAERNRDGQGVPVALMDSGVSPFMGTVEIARSNRERFFEFGAQDHAGATIAGAASLEGVVTVWTARASHALDAAYQQLRLNDLNGAHVKLFVSHLGSEGGGDGRALMCLDYVGIAESLPACRAVFPADANQADRVVRYVLGEPGNWLVGLGVSPVPVITDEEGRPLFGRDYRFEYGRIDRVRPGDDGVILTTGPSLAVAVEAWAILRDRGFQPTVLHVSCPKALEDTDDPLLLQCLRKGRVITYEDHNVRTGLGARIASIIATRGISCRLLKLGVPGAGLAGAPEDVHRRLGLDAGALAARAAKFLKR